LKDKDLEEATFKIDTQGDAFRLQQDYIPIGGDKGSESGSDTSYILFR
jgi:hypothetical protein